MSCAAALGVIDAIETEGHLSRADAQGAIIRGRLDELAKPAGSICNVRPLGAMIAFDVRSGDAKTPASRCLERGFMFLTCGPHSQSVRNAAPLTTSDRLLSEGMNILAGYLRGA